MNVKIRKEFMTFIRYFFIFAQAQDLHSAGVGVTEVVITRLPRRTMAKQRFL